MSEIPQAPGFYWAQWRIASPGTREAEELTPSFEWEVVEVFKNSIDEDDDEHLMVSVSGVEKGQALDAFVWGSGPLSPPAEIAAALNTEQSDASP
jgi:hypothetical protein